MMAVSPTGGLPLPLPTSPDVCKNTYVASGLSTPKRVLLHSVRVCGFLRSEKAHFGGPDSFGDCLPSLRQWESHRCSRFSDEPLGLLRGLWPTWTSFWKIQAFSGSQSPWPWPSCLAFSGWAHPFTPTYLPPSHLTVSIFLKSTSRPIVP